MMNTFCLILTTAPDEETARNLAKSLVESRKAACVTTSPPCESRYWWEGKIAEDKEYVLLIKTRKDLFDGVEAMIRELHPYDVPEVVAIDIVRGSEAYFGWIDRETRS